MTLATRRRSRSPASEEAIAAVRVILALTIAVGGMAAVMGAGTGLPLIVAAVPTVALVIALMIGAVPLAGWAGVAVWAVLLPSAHGEAILAPLAMIALCLAIAIGPERLTSWIGRDVSGRNAEDERKDEGWIEEDGHSVD